MFFFAHSRSSRTQSFNDGREREEEREREREIPTKKKIKILNEKVSRIQSVFFSDQKKKKKM